MLTPADRKLKHKPCSGFPSWTRAVTVRAGLREGGGGGVVEREMERERGGWREGEGTERKREREREADRQTDRDTDR